MAINLPCEIPFREAIRSAAQQLGLSSAALLRVSAVQYVRDHGLDDLAEQMASAMAERKQVVASGSAHLLAAATGSTTGEG